MQKFEVYVQDKGAEFVLEKTIEAQNINKALDMAYPEGCHKWRYVKKVKEKKNGKEEDSVYGSGDDGIEDETNEETSE